MVRKLLASPKGSGAVQIIMGIGVAFLLILLAINFLPDMLTASDQVLTDEDEITANITTGGAETTGTVTLTNALYDADTARVGSITSTWPGDSPSPSSYSSSTQVLTVGGLEVSQTRVLTVVHEYDGLGDYIAAGETVKMGPVLLLLVIFVGIPAAMIMAVFGYSRVRG